MFDAIAITFGALALLTLWREYRRAWGGTLLSLLTLGNVFYGGLTPVIAYYWPEESSIFNAYINDAGINVTETGLINVMIMVTLFQLASLVVSLRKSKKTKSIKLDKGSSKSIANVPIFIGWFMVLIGIIGAVWLGLTYNGNPWGLYQISYAERTPLFRENSSQAFLLLLGLYGASQLIVSFLMTGRVKPAALVLLLVMLHGIGIKSKYPIFWVSLTFLFAAIGEGVNLRKIFPPMGSALLVLMTMSVLRGVEGLSDLPHHISRYQEEVKESAIRFWENDIPGPASMTYFIINTPPAEYSIEPLLAIPKLLIPKFIYDRGAQAADVWAEKMMGSSSYETGLGYGWSLLNDGYLLAGWLGVIVVGYTISWSARYLTDLKLAGQHPYFFTLVMYTAAPLFFLGYRESVAGFLKALLVIAVTLWIPALIWTNLQKSKKLSKDEA